MSHVSIERSTSAKTFRRCLAAKNMYGTWPRYSSDIRPEWYRMKTSRCTRYMIICECVHSYCKRFCVGSGSWKQIAAQIKTRTTCSHSSLSLFIPIFKKIEYVECAHIWNSSSSLPAVVRSLIKNAHTIATLDRSGMKVVQRCIGVSWCYCIFLYTIRSLHL